MFLELIMSCTSEPSPCCIGKVLYGSCHLVIFNKSKKNKGFEELSEQNQELA